MEAPLHKFCGTKHWSNQECPAMAKSEIKSPTPVDPSQKKQAKVKGATARKSVAPTPIKSSRSSTGSERRTSKAKVAGSSPAASTKKQVTKPAGSLTPANVKRTLTRAKKVLAKPKIKRAPKAAKPSKMGRPRKTPEGFDKVAYQREYMKTYRATKKAKPQ